MIRNFLFHRVNPKRDRLWDPMDVKLFERCIKYISRNYEVILFENIAFSKELYAKKNYAAIMFDDGYKDNIDYAAPILKKYNCKASFYVVTECIEKNIVPWTHILEHLFQFTGVADVLINFDFLADDLKVNNLNTKEERIQYVSKLKPYLKKLSHEDRTIFMNYIINAYNDVEMPKLMMDWEDLRVLKSSGHYIGSHTVTHCMLGTMHDENEIKNELINSLKAIENNLGHLPLTISYPVGSYNQATKKISEAAGYKIGLAVKQTIYHPDKDNRFEIPRIELYNEPWWKTRLRITHTLETIKTFIRYK